MRQTLMGDKTRAYIRLLPVLSAHTAESCVPGTRWLGSQGEGGGPFGAGAMLNGEVLPSSIRDGGAIGEVPVAGVRTERGALSLPPISVTFSLVEGVATPPECDE